MRISYGIIDRFSEGLYSSSTKAFEELVSNSYDAGASRVWVRVPEDLHSAGAYLAVIDDGVSMDLDGLRELWRIGVSPKRAPDGTEVMHAGRAPIGKFGIGKLATYVLAEKLGYVCRAEGVIRAVTMDFGLAKGEMIDPTTKRNSRSTANPTISTATTAPAMASGTTTGRRTGRYRRWTVGIGSLPSSRRT